MEIITSPKIILDDVELVLIKTHKNILEAELFCDMYDGSLYFPDKYFDQIREFTKKNSIHEFYVALKQTENGFANLDNTPFLDEICISNKQSNIMLNTFCSMDHVISNGNYFSAVMGTQMYPFLCQFDRRNVNASSNSDCIPCEKIIDAIDITSIIGKISQNFYYFCNSQLFPSNNNIFSGFCSKVKKNLFTILHKLQKLHFVDYNICKFNEDCDKILPENDCSKCKYVLKQIKYMFIANQNSFSNIQYNYILNFIFGEITIIDDQNFSINESMLIMNSEDSTPDLCLLVSLC